MYCHYFRRFKHYLVFCFIRVVRKGGIMKKYFVLLLLIFAIFVFSLSAFAVPQLINYQGKLTDSAGTPITGTKSVSFSIYNTSTGGTSLWSETQSVNLTNGIFSVSLGSVNPIPSSVFSSDDSYLGITVDSDSEMTPRQRITSDGYSYKSGTSDAVSDGAVGTSSIADGAVTDAKIFSLDAAKLTGTVSDSQISSVSASKLTGTISGNGSGLTGLNASSLSFGSVADALLSPNVVLLNSAQTVTGLKAFNPSTGTVPFMVDPSKSDVVTNLNADMVGGKHASDLIGAAGGTMTGPIMINYTGMGNAVFGNMSGAFGDAGYFKISNRNNGGPAIHGSTTGTGSAGVFEINNTSDSLPSVWGSTNGAGPAILGVAYGTGRAGDFEINNAGSSADVLRAGTNGSGYAGNFNGKVNVNGNLTVGGIISGNGSGLTNLPASGISAAGAAMLNAAQTFTGANTFYASGSSPAVYGETVGTGRAVDFEITNASNSNAAVYGSTNGSGPAVYGYTTGAGRAAIFTSANTFSGGTALTASSQSVAGGAGDFEININPNPNPAIKAFTAGSGPAVYGTSYFGGGGDFEIYTASNTQPAVYGYTTGTGNAVFGNMSGASGSSGYFKISNRNNNSAAVYGTTNGGGNAVTGWATGTGPGIFGTSYGTGNAGDFQINNSNNNSASVYGYTMGVGQAGYFQISNASSTADALYSYTNGTGNAGNFNGKVSVSGNEAVGGNLTVTGSITGGSFTGNGSGLTGITASQSGAVPTTTTVNGHALSSNVTVTQSDVGLGNVTNVAQVNKAGDTMTGPLAVNTAGAAAGVASTMSGSGKAGDFVINNASNSDTAVYGQTNGSGNAVYGYTSGTGNAVNGTTNGTGNAVVGNTTGAGDAIVGTTTGTWRAGDFEINNASNTADALYATTNGTGNAGNFGGKVNVSGNLTVGGTITGSGVSLGNLNASNLASGTVPDPRLSGTYSNAINLTNTGNTLFGNGWNLVNLNASNLASGTVAVARLSADVPLLNATQNFTGANTFSASTTNFNSPVNLNSTVTVGAPVTAYAPVIVNNSITGNTVSGQVIYETNPSVPSSSSAAGSPGQISWDANYVYICVGTNTWKRAALTSW
jgi:hypothetical protein